MRRLCHERTLVDLLMFHLRRADCRSSGPCAISSTDRAPRGPTFFYDGPGPASERLWSTDDGLDGQACCITLAVSQLGYPLGQRERQNLTALSGNRLRQNSQVLGADCCFVGADEAAIVSPVLEMEDTGKHSGCSHTCAGQLDLTAARSREIGRNPAEYHSAANWLMETAVQRAVGLTRVLEDVLETNKKPTIEPNMPIMTFMVNHAATIINSSLLNEGSGRGWSGSQVHRDIVVSARSASRTKAPHEDRSRTNQPRAHGEVRASGPSGPPPVLLFRASQRRGRMRHHSGMSRVPSSAIWKSSATTRRHA